MKLKHVTLALLSAVLTAGQPNPPQLLTNALQRLPGLTILEPKIDLRNIVSAQEVGDESWAQADFDRDEVLDVAAIVTARAKSGTRFGLLVVLSSSPNRVFWLVPLAEAPLYGVEFFRINTNTGSIVSRDRVVPVACTACDSGTWFRWSGRAFVRELYAADDVVATADQEILGEPHEGARIVAKSGPCARVKAIDFRGADPKTRWYFIETVERNPKRGWIPASAVFETSPVPQGKLCWWKQ